MHVNVFANSTKKRNYTKILYIYIFFLYIFFYSEMININDKVLELVMRRLHFLINRQTKWREEIKNIIKQKFNDWSIKRDILLQLCPKRKKKPETSLQYQVQNSSSSDSCSVHVYFISSVLCFIFPKAALPGEPNFLLGWCKVLPR